MLYKSFCLILQDFLGVLSNKNNQKDHTLFTYQDVTGFCHVASRAVCVCVTGLECEVVNE